MKTLTRFALGTLFSLSVVGTALAAGTTAAAPASLPDTAIEVIVVTAKRPVLQPVGADQPIYEVVVTAKRAREEKAQRTPPVTAIEMPKVELAVVEPLVIRL